MRVFVVGASGAIGEPMIAELLKQGHTVVGMRSSEARAKNLESQGVTSLPKELGGMPQYAAGDRKLRLEGGGHQCR